MMIVLSDRDLAVVRQWYEMARGRRGPTPGLELARNLGFEEKKADGSKAAAAG
jgi:hypothetical protein